MAPAGRISASAGPTPAAAGSVRLLQELATSQVVRPPEGQRHDGAGGVRLGGLGQDHAQHGVVRAVVAHGAEGEAEGVGHEAGEGRLGQPCDLRDLRDRHGCHACLVEPPLEQSDRLLADRSGGHQEGEVCLLGEHALDGERDGLGQETSTVGHESHGGDHGGGERTDEAGVRQRLEGTNGVDDVRVGLSPGGVVADMGELERRISRDGGGGAACAKRTRARQVTPAVDTSVTRASERATGSGLRGDGSFSRTQSKSLTPTTWRTKLRSVVAKPALSSPSTGRDQGSIGTPFHTLAAGRAGDDRGWPWSPGCGSRGEGKAKPPNGVPEGMPHATPGRRRARH